MYLSKIKVTLRKSILDPQGKAVQHAIGAMHVDGIKDVRMGKYIELTIEAESENLARIVTEEVCKKLLANPVMEDYHFDIEKM